MSRLDNCPHCGVSLQGNPIPEADQYMFNGLHAKPGDPGWVTHFERAIGVEVQGVYDGVLFYECPDCGGRWNRWPSPVMNPRVSELYKLAEKHMREVPGARKRR